MVFEEYIANDYLRSLVMAILFLVIARVIVIILLKTFKQLTKKTKTEIDNIIMKKSAMPLTIIIFLFAIKIPLNELPLTDTVHGLIGKIISSIVMLIIAYLIYVLFDKIRRAHV